MVRPRRETKHGGGSGESERSREVRLREGDYLPSMESFADVLADKVAERLPLLDAEDRWITSAQAADYLAVPISTLRKLTAAGSVPFAQDVAGGRCYFKRSELDRWRREGHRSSRSMASEGDRMGSAKPHTKWPRDVTASGAVAQGDKAP